MSKQHNSQQFFCRDAYCTQVCKILGKNPFTVSRGNHVRTCQNVKRYGSCRGAHKEEDVKPRLFIQKFNSLDFSKLDLGKYDDAICAVINNCAGKVSDAVLSKELIKFKTMNFVERLQLWVKLNFYKSDLKKRNMACYIKLGIENTRLRIVEDYMWALERVTHMCPEHIEFKRKIANKQMVTIRDPCLGSTNCKLGAHHQEQLINISDFLTGVSTSEISKEVYNKDCETISQSIKEISIKMESIEKEIITFKQSKNNKKQRKTENYLSKLEGMRSAKIRTLKHYPRERHLTEEGLVPMCVYIEKKKNNKEEERIKLESSKDVSKKVKRRVVMKPSLD